MEFLEALTQFGFLQRALITAVIVGILCGVVGAFTVLRGLALMGDAISHAVLPGVAVSFLLGISFFPGALAAGLITAGAIGYVNQKSRIKSDAAIGIVFTTMFALGVVLISLAPSSTDLTKILFGNLLAVRQLDMWITIGVGAVVLTLVTLFFKELQASSFDPTWSRAYGLSTTALHYLLMGLLTLVTVASLQTVGIILVVAMLVIPASTAYLLTEKLGPMILLSAALGAISGVIGMTFSFTFNVPSGATIVLASAVIFAAAFFISRRLIGARRLLPVIGVTTLASVLMFAKVPGLAAEKEIKDDIAIVASFSIVADIAANVAGPDVQLHSIVPIGVDPHEYTPLPNDIEAATEADVVFYNGLNMEVGDGWFESLVDIAGKEMDSAQVVEVSTGVEPMYLTTTEGGEHEVNPHAFLDPNVGMIYTENIRDALIQIDPDHASAYSERAADYLAQLEAIDTDYRTKLDEIPQEQRVLVTSENAYQYLADRYGLTTGYIWAIDTEEQGSPTQITDLVELIHERSIPAVFVESNVDTRPMETVAAEAGVPIAGTLFSDELGKPGEVGGTYLKMLEHNLAQVHAGLTGSTS
ncbi:MAG TPA: zinc ABC transporter substrate-binding protein [Actinomycetales bacterium]|nr:zinc ABC transporter substrate-binding protein [Actinomycetales bacterium]